MQVLSDGRVRRSRSEWQEIPKRFGKSGLTEAAFCRREKISRGRFVEWKRRLRKPVAGAERAAVAYTVLATCALHEVDPWAYIKDVLEKIAGGWSQRDIDRLLPDRWLEEHPEALRRNPPA